MAMHGSVYGKCVGCDPIQYIESLKWVHRKCTEMKGSLYKDQSSFVCSGCVNTVVDKGKASVNTGMKWSIGSVILEIC